MTDSTVISLHNWSVTYGNTPILNNINHDFGTGIHVLTGLSGCGKSSLLYSINGVIPFFNKADVFGEIVFQGRPIHELDMADRSRIIASVFQNPKTQFFSTDTTDELAFYLESFALDPDEIIHRIKTYTHNLGTEKLLDRNIFELSGGEKQLLAVTSAVAAQTPVLLLDEPSASLDGEALLHLKRVLERIKDKTCIILADHRLFYLADILDEVCVIENGSLTAYPASKLNANITRHHNLRSLSVPDFKQLKEKSTKIKNSELVSKRAVNSRSWREVSRLQSQQNESHIPQISKILELKNYRFSYRNSPPLFNLNTYFEPGITFLIGKNGVGKTTLIRSICGLQKAKGKQYFNNKEDRKRDKASLVMQDVNGQLITDSLENELRLVSDDEISITSALKEVNLFQRKDEHPHVLSGGQKQRLILAQALISPKPIILLDEPTSGLCSVSMKKTASIMRQMVNNGKMVIVITHDCEFIEHVPEAHIVELVE